MIIRVIKNKPWFAFWNLLILAIAGNVISGLLFAALAYLIPPFKEILYQGAPPTGEFYRAMLSLNFPMTFLLPSILIAQVYKPHYVKEVLKTDKKPYTLFMIFAIVSIIICQPALNLIGEWNKNFQLPDLFSSLELWIKKSELEAETISNLITQTTLIETLLLNILVVGILPGICEEILFRGIIQSLFLDIIKNKHVVVWLVAFLFSFIHFQFYGFIPRLLLGAMLGYLTLYSDSLWSSILAHSFNNTMVVILTYLQYNKYISAEIDRFGLGNQAWIGIVSLIISIVIFSLISKIALKIPSGKSAIIE